jgi:hypothetical protein
LAQLNAEFDAQWRRMPSNDQKAMRSVIGGGGSAFRQAVLNRLDLDKSTAQGAVKRLADSADIEPVGRQFRVVDPLFEQWVARIDSGEAERFDGES